MAALVALLITIVVGLTVYYIAPWIYRRYGMSRIRNSVTKRRMLALTYDDGPSLELTPRLLDLLHRRGARATFFMQGKHARQHPEIVDRIIQEGHSVGCHNDNHVNAWTSWPMTAMADMDAGYKSLSRWIRSNAMYRPPHGKITAATWWWIRRRGAQVIWWTIDSGDTNKVLPSADEIAKTVREEGGGIVLMHDINRPGGRNEFVLEVTSALLDLAEEESLQILPLTEVHP